MLAHFYWNPPRELFYIPGLNIPIFFYSIFFAIGFAVGYYIFLYILRLFFLNYYTFTKKDIVDEKLFIKSINESDLFKSKTSTLNDALGRLNNLYEEKKVSDVLSKIKDEKYKKKLLLNNKVCNFLDYHKSLIRAYLESFFTKSMLTSKAKALLITDKFTIWMIISTLIGARLGHIIFYEDLSYFLKNPLKIIKVWEGGLASHGATVAIIIMIICFSKYLKKYSPKISFLNLLDIVSIPTALAGFCIRIGNFFNQEILGVPTNSFLGVVFGRPADGSFPIPRHPVQLYEAVFYLLTFILLFWLGRKAKVLLVQGKLIGLFFILIYGFRFFVEFFKEKQSLLISGKGLLMGQYLSIPFVLLGIILVFISKIRSK
jgi:phosphatidylglycerol---prolipoprotein diacylglyceryl transferase